MALFVIIATLRNCNAAIAQSVEHVIGNDEVIGPNPISSSIRKTHPVGWVFLMELFIWREERCSSRLDV